MVKLLQCCRLCFVTHGEVITNTVDSCFVTHGEVITILYTLFCYTWWSYYNSVNFVLLTHGERYYNTVDFVFVTHGEVITIL